MMAAVNGVVLQVLKKDCIAALRRIFKLCDINKDGILDAAELNEFQVGVLPSVSRRIKTNVTASPIAEMF